MNRQLELPALNLGNAPSDSACFDWAAQAESDPVISSARNSREDLLKIHEYERQRMGQELHDSAGQLLVSLQLSVARLKAVECDSGHEDILKEIQDTISEIDREIRAVAFLHYPAELGDRSISSAVEMLTRGFGRRTGIRTSFKCIGDPSPVDESTSIALLRVAQESLVNIHRHSHANSARVVLRKTANQLRLTVSDNGIGIRTSSAASSPRGIGLQGMRYRIETLGGRFQVKRMRNGTTVAATVPITV